MAVSVSNREFGLSSEGAGGKRTCRADVAIDSYAAAGEAVAAADFGLGALDKVDVLGLSSNGFVVRYDAGLLRAYAQDASGTAATNSVGLREADAADNVGTVAVRAFGW